MESGRYVAGIIKAILVKEKSEEKLEYSYLISQNINDPEEVLAVAKEQDMINIEV